MDEKQLLASPHFTLLVCSVFMSYMFSIILLALKKSLDLQLFLDRVMQEEKEKG